ncbi:MAG: hypothetical protein SchgKO_11880 [Schleiferiaceae bacterium]
MHRALRKITLLLGLLMPLVSVAQFGEDDPDNYPFSSFTLKTAPIRYIYGLNAEVEYAITDAFAITAGYQYMARDFLSPDVNYNTVDNIATFSLYNGSGNRFTVGGRYYLPQEYISRNDFYLEARFFSKTFSLEDSVEIMDKNGSRYSVWYREDQTAIGTQLLFGWKYSNWLYKPNIIGEIELFAGLGYYFRERKIAYWVPPGPNNSEDFVQDFQSYSSPQITFGLLVGLGM